MTQSTLRKHALIIAIFLLTGVYISTVAPTLQVTWVCAVVLLAIYLFVFEVVKIDVAAITVMVTLGLSVLVAPWIGLSGGLVPSGQLYSGFSSNAVISIIAVMIIGAGMDKAGIMGKVADFILALGGKNETKVTILLSASVGFVSSFMQNVGATALFLPVVSRIAARTGIAPSRMLMPVAFAAILGGAVTMVGSSPMILLNDLIEASNLALPADQQVPTFGLFEVTPVGLTLLIVGILYFAVAGKYLLPEIKNEHTHGHNTVDYFSQTYNMPGFELHEVLVPENSPLVGQNVDTLEATYQVRVIALDKGDGIHFGAGSVNIEMGIHAGTRLGILGSDAQVDKLSQENKLEVKPELNILAGALEQGQAGVAEVVIRPGSALIGKSAREVRLRKTYGLNLLAIHRSNETLGCDSGQVHTTPLQSGDTLIVHVAWADLAELESDRDFVVITSEYPHEEVRSHKVPHALICFGIALCLVLFTDLRLSTALLTGAIGIVLCGVLSIDEAYKSVSWQTVFLLASLIPLGIAVESSGTAKWIAEQTLVLLDGMPIWVVQTALALLTVFFTMVMSNLGATVLLVPLAINMALAIGANPAIFALTVAVSTSNAFFMPTNQVNVLVMAPAGYRTADFLRAGGIMSMLFLVISLVVLNAFV